MRADDVEIGRACPIDLRERIADGTAEFHCDHCDRSVHVLSHMSEEAAARVLARRKRDNLCVAFLRASDGQVHFRREGEALVPASRLGGRRTMLRASALALTMAACVSNDDGRVEPVDLDSFEQPSLEPPVSVQPHAHVVEPKAEQYEVHAGAPPLLDDVAEVPCGPNGEPHVEFETLVPISTPEPAHRDLAATKLGREGGPTMLVFDYCVDEKGKVVDAKRVTGDEELARLFVRQMKRWRFEPPKVDGRKTRVCTTQRIRLLFDDRPA